MIEKIIDLSIKNKFLVILMTVFVIAAGILCDVENAVWMPYRIFLMHR